MALYIVNGLSLWGWSSIRKVTFIFVPGHAGIQGNETADRLANCVVIADWQAMEQQSHIDRQKGGF
jgi:ribonuclease HI